MTQEDNNKQIATTAYQRLFGDLDDTAVDEYISEGFIQHNPTIADGPEGVKTLIRMLISQGVWYSPLSRPKSHEIKIDFG